MAARIGIVNMICFVAEMISTGIDSKSCMNHIDSTVKDIMYNHAYEELFALDVGPENLFKWQQGAVKKYTFWIC